MQQMTRGGEDMADHLDAPGLNSPATDARVDITDHYAFQKPGDPHKTIMILNVNPLAPSHAREFRHDAVYETLVDTNTDAQPDIAFRYRFSNKVAGQQFARVTRVELTRALEDGHLEGDHKAETLVEHAPVSFGSDAEITNAEDGVRFFAGFRSDPFFFDLLGFLNGLKFTGSDFFADKNVFGIALEVPNRLLGNNPNVGIWTRTLVPMTLQPNHLTQVKQMGRPGINTVFNHGNDLLPDILTFNFNSAAGFLNGRRLQDDVIDISLNLVTNGHVASDGVGPHTDYLAQFPYLGTPHIPHV